MNAREEILTSLAKSEQYIRSKTNLTPRVGLILGSGLGALAEHSPEDTIFLFSELPHFCRPTVEGHTGKLIIGRFGDKPAVVMQGRLHYYEGYGLDEVIYPVRLMRRLGVEYLIITAAAGGINPAYADGDIVFLKDHINLMGSNCLRGEVSSAFGERFADMSEVYPVALRRRGMDCAKKHRIRAHEGVYLGVSGPSYETPAEIRAFRKLGADIVGMSVVPEAVAARQMGMKTLAFAYVANGAAGRSRRSLSHASVLATGKKVSSRVGTLLADIVSSFE